MSTTPRTRWKPTSTPRWWNWKRSTRTTSTGCMGCCRPTWMPPTPRSASGSWPTGPARSNASPRGCRATTSGAGRASPTPSAPAPPPKRRSGRPPVPDPKGFLKYTHRETPKRRPVDLRLKDWDEVYEDFPHSTLQHQATRCMDCGIPFCHNGCPLGNLIPEWNDLVRRGRWRDAIERLHATNNFPDFTGRLCPAPCEPACVLGINQDPVTIKQIELDIIDRAFEEGFVVPLPPDKLTGKTVAVVVAGPAGLAAAQQLTRAGHSVTVFERDDRIGGLLRYGNAAVTMGKRHLERRLEQMRAEGTEFRPSVNVGVDITAEQLRAEFDAVVLAGGAAALGGSAAAAHRLRGGPQ